MKKIIILLVLSFLWFGLFSQESEELSDYEKYRLEQEKEQFGNTDTVYIIEKDTVYIKKETQSEPTIVNNNYYVDSDYRQKLYFGYDVNRFYSYDYWNSYWYDYYYWGNRAFYYSWGDPYYYPRSYYYSYYPRYHSYYYYPRYYYSYSYPVYRHYNHSNYVSPYRRTYASGSLGNRTKYYGNNVRTSGTIGSKPVSSSYTRVNKTYKDPKKNVQRTNTARKVTTNQSRHISTANENNFRTYKSSYNTPRTSKSSIESRSNSSRSNYSRPRSSTYYRYNNSGNAYRKTTSSERSYSKSSESRSTYSRTSSSSNRNTYSRPSNTSRSYSSPSRSSSSRNSYSRSSSPSRSSGSMRSSSSNRSKR